MPRSRRSFAHARGRATSALPARYDREDADVPVGHVEVYVDTTYSGIRDHVRTMKVSVAETIEKLYGIAIARIEQEIAVELLTVDQAAALAVTPETPALVIRRWYSGENLRDRFQPLSDGPLRLSQRSAAPGAVRIVQSLSARRA
ncbi:UTRA domain-containing protein [Aquamicrobium sp. LC103]|uniref:UTRA domain-containing protein n=1 Tax=Aquamicrobium sp. LC103 TaxID=1120658 RepID=UPI0009E1E266|nr:UTRA domain-containing protein [Aquamicrobium sp. LC103]TKT69892.1 UTRA domain-containing protein [Aquamicrobium sp. LC103]